MTLRNKVEDAIKSMVLGSRSYRSIADELKCPIEYVKEVISSSGVAPAQSFLSIQEKEEISNKVLKGFPLEVVASYYGIEKKDVEVLVYKKEISSFKSDGLRTSKKLDPFKSQIAKHVKNRDMSTQDLSLKYGVSFQTMHSFIHSSILKSGQKKEYPIFKKNKGKEELEFILPPEAYAVAKKMSATQLSSVMTRALVRQA